MIDQYNMYMGGVDKADQLLSYYSFSHHTVKWWRCVFFHLVDNAVVNAYILYRISSQPGRKFNHKQFRIELAKLLLGSVFSLMHNLPHHHNALPPPARLTEGHFLEKSLHVSVVEHPSQFVWCVLIRGGEEEDIHLSLQAVHATHVCSALL